MPDESSGEIRVNRIKKIFCPQGHEVDISRAKPLSMIACPDCGQEVRVAAQIAHYLIVKPLARGRCGVVYQAYDEMLTRQVALKIIYQAVNGDGGEDRTQEATREAQVLATMNHPNIVQVYSLDEDMGQPFIVMELVDGGRLAETIADHGTIREAKALRIGEETARGLAEANKLGRTHGDIKPQNILFARDGAAKLIDFGLSMRIGTKASDTCVLGTPYYVAPEVVRGQIVDQRSDMYSLGATLYHALTGRPPFMGDEPRQVMMARLNEAPPELLGLRPDVSRHTAELIHRMLAIEPHERHDDMPQLARALRGRRLSISRKAKP